MAAIHEKQWPRSLKQMLFLPAGFGVDAKYRLRSYIVTEEDVIAASKLAFDFCSRHELSKSRAVYVSLCIEELGMNAVKHGFSKQDQSAEVNLSLVKDKLILRFRDNGKAFDLTKWLKFFRPDDPASHLGIRILVGLAKKVSYTSALDTNNVLIEL